MSQTYVYPFDPTGSLTSNVIPNERHVLSEVPSREFSFIVPKFAPFFGRGFRIRHLGLSRDLVEGVDYHLTHWFHAGSHGVGRQLYGSITFLDKRLTGVVELRYQTIGGDWVYDENTILEIMSNRLINPRITTWEQVVDLPFQFPVIDHEWALDDLTGASEVVAKLQAITEAINAANEANGSSHVSDYTNPHNVTKQQIGLGNIENYLFANIAEAKAGLSNELYMTPARVRNFAETYVPPLVEAHTNRTDNPHGVNKTQVGLGNVQNFGVATNADAINGISSILYLTPASLKAVVETNVLPSINSHINATDNPHAVTKVQVGLGNVPNYAASSEAEALAGSRNDRFMTPLTTYQLVNQYVGEGMGQHISNVANPHRVSKTQVGLGNVENYPIATLEEAVAGLSNVLYITPMSLNKAITDIAIASYREHTNDDQNPHNVTKQQVGLGNVDNYRTATVEEAIAGTTSNRFMTPVTTAAVLANIVGESLEGHTLLRDNPHRVTKDQVGLGNVENYPIATSPEALIGVSDVLYMTPLTTLQVAQSASNSAVQAHANRKTNPHEVTAAQVGATTLAEVQSLLLGYMVNGATASNSEKLDGRTYQDILDSVSGGVADNTLLFAGNTVEQLRDIYTQHIIPLATHLEGLSLDEVADYTNQSAVAPLVFNLERYISPTGVTTGWTKLFETDLKQFSIQLSFVGVLQTDLQETSILTYHDTDSDTVGDRKLTRHYIKGKLYDHEVYVKSLNNINSVWIKHNVNHLSALTAIVNGGNKLADFTLDVVRYDDTPDWLGISPIYVEEFDSCVEVSEILMTQSTIELMIETKLDAFAESMRDEAIAAAID